MAVDPANPAIIYVGASNGLFRSTDGGGSWHLLNAELRKAQQILVGPTDPLVLYARRQGTPEEGRSGLELPGIFKSTDGGATWQVKGAGTGEKIIYSIALDPAAPQVLYAGTFNGLIFKSTDAGESWAESGAERPALPGLSPRTINGLLVHPRTGAIYALASKWGTFRSSDGGQTWAAVHRDTGYLAFDATTETLYLAGRSLWKSTDGGETWEDISGNLYYDPEYSSHLLYWVGVNPDPPALYVWQALAWVARSTDGGTTWTYLDMGGRFHLAGMQAGPQPVLYGNADEEGTLGRYVDTGIP